MNVPAAAESHDSLLIESHQSHIDFEASQPVVQEQLSNPTQDENESSGRSHSQDIGTSRSAVQFQIELSPPRNRLPDVAASSPVRFFVFNF